MNSSKIMTPVQESTGSNYAMLRVALEFFGKPPASLSPEEHGEVLRQVNRELAIGKRVLQGGDASEVVIPESVVEQAIDSLAKRYDCEEEFLQALETNGLDRYTLHQALHYELKVEAVLEKIVAERSVVCDTEVEIYYLQHMDKFELPETRTARHILITINEEYEDNHRERAMQRIAEIQQRLVEGGEEFTALAQRYSECPTAMQEGVLGRVKPGQLYPELDKALFEMAEGELSEVIESPVGLHLLLCQEIHGAERRRYDEVKEKLREHLEKKKRKRVLHDWLQKKS